MATEDAIRTLVEHREEFVGFLARKVGNPQLAEDLFQDAFTRGLERIDQVRDQESIVAWFYRALRNAVMDHYRRGGSTAARSSGSRPSLATPRRRPSSARRSAPASRGWRSTSSPSTRTRSARST